MVDESMVKISYFIGQELLIPIGEEEIVVI